MAPLNLKARAGCTLGACMEFSRSGKLGGAACCLSGVAGEMDWRLRLVWGPGGGEDGVSMSIAGCYDRGSDPGQKFQNLDRLL